MLNYVMHALAGADHTSNYGKAISVAGTIAATNTATHGILCNKPRSGEDASLVHWGRAQFRAGGAIAAGAKMAVTTSGYLVTCGSGDLAIGTNEGTAVSSGMLGWGFFNCTVRSNPGA